MRTMNQEERLETADGDWTIMIYFAKCDFLILIEERVRDIMLAPQIKEEI